MIQRLQQRRNGEEGFTLVELLVVIVILGILAAIVVFAVNGVTDKGNIAACKSDTSSLSAAEEAVAAQATSPSFTAATISTTSGVTTLALTSGTFASTDKNGTVSGTGTASGSSTAIPAGITVKSFTDATHVVLQGGAIPDMTAVSVTLGRNPYVGQTGSSVSGDLVSKGFLHAPPTLHTVGITDSSAPFTYSITAAANSNCGSN